MKVKELICNTQWLPGRSYLEGPIPIVSVLLPTFRRAKSGRLRKAIESVLSQTRVELELIIVDDASTDGSADVIAEFMERDGRVSCLRHEENIGLPAISEYEAYSKSRGQYIAFAFDDDVFFPDALYELYTHAQSTPDQVVYGSVAMKVNWAGSGDGHVEHLGASLSANNINSWNYIPNNAVLVPRFILEDIGLYDPHILMTRVCDWDLWRRVSRKYILRYVNVSVGEVGGPATDDSLGKTYALDSWASEERIRQERDSSLRPGSFEEYDIFGLPENTTYCTVIAAREMAVAHARARKNFTFNNEFKESHDNQKILVITGHYDASTTVTFDFLPAEWKSRIRVIRPWHWPVSEIARASCVIFVRQLEPFSEWIDAAKKLQIPCYYFIDDNLTLLQENKQLGDFEDVSKSALRQKLKDFSGVLTSTKTLQHFFQEHLLHRRIEYFPPAFRGVKLFTDNSLNVRDKLVVAFAGGNHRLSALQDVILPALVKYAETGRKVQLVAGNVGAEFSDEFERYEYFELIAIPSELNWETALLRIAKYRPDILIHAPSESANNIYKTMNVAMSANVLNAVLVVPDYFPYSQVKEFGMGYVVSSPFSARSWLDMLEGLNFSDFSNFKQRNKRFCEEHFSGLESCQVLNSISESSVLAGFSTVESRMKLLLANQGGSDVTSGGTLRAPHKLAESLNELAILRHMISTSRRLSFMARKLSLWESLMPQFGRMKEFSLAAKKVNTATVLELSKSLHDVPYLEYVVDILAGVKSIQIAFTTDGLQDGIVGVELVDSSETIVFNKILSMKNLNLSLPVEFVVDCAIVISSSNYKLRVFAQASHPVYIFELVKYSYAGLKRRPVFPLMEILTV